MSTLIFDVLAFILGCLTVLAPRPVVRTAFLSGFLALIFAALNATVVGCVLGFLASAPLVIDLCFYREPKPVDDIGDRQTASATVDEDETYEAAKLRRDAAKARLAEAKASGDYSNVSDRVVKDAGLPVLELEHDTIQIFPGSTDIIQVAKDGTTTVTAVHITHDLVKVVEEAGYTTTRVTS